MSLNLNNAIKILNTSEFQGTATERAASRARWRRLVEKHPNSPLILNEDYITLALVCRTFIHVDSQPFTPSKKREVIALLLY